MYVLQISAFNMRVSRLRFALRNLYSIDADSSIWRRIISIVDLALVRLSENCTKHPVAIIAALFHYSSRCVTHSGFGSLR